MDDPYKTLGVSREASQDDIRKAYRTLAKHHHPDLNPGQAGAEERFKAIASANALLSDPIKRGQFDRGEIDAASQQRPGPFYRDFAEGEAGQRYSSSAPADEWSPLHFNDIFDTIFNVDRGGGARDPIHGHGGILPLTISFLDAVNGATRRLTLPDGRVLDVKIPSGSVEGQSLRLRGQNGKGGPDHAAVDVLIEIHVTPHRYFVRDGLNLRLQLPVTLAEAVLGATVEVPTPGGPVRMTVPPGSENGTELRLRGRGVPGLADRPAGDLYASLRVVLGTPDTALETFLRSWKPEHPLDPRRMMEAGS